jgi:hypothetical protein
MKLILTLILLALVTGVQAEPIEWAPTLKVSPNITITDEDVLVCVVDFTRSIIPVLMCQKMGEVSRDKPAAVIPFDPTKIKIWDGKRLW